MCRPRQHVRCMNNSFWLNFTFPPLTRKSCEVAGTMWFKIFKQLRRDWKNQGKGPWKGKGGNIIRVEGGKATTKVSKSIISLKERTGNVMKGDANKKPANTFKIKAMSVHGPLSRLPGHLANKFVKSCKMAVTYLCLVLQNFVCCISHKSCLLEDRLSLSCFLTAPLLSTLVYHFGNKWLQGLHALPHYMQHCCTQLASIRASKLKAGLDLPFPAVVTSLPYRSINYIEILLVTNSRHQMYATFVRSRKMRLRLLQYVVLLLSYKNRKKFS